MDPFDWQKKRRYLRFSLPTGALRDETKNGCEGDYLRLGTLKNTACDCLNTDNGERRDVRAHRSTRHTKAACVNPKKRRNEGSGGEENIPNWALSLVPGNELKIFAKSLDY